MMGQTGPGRFYAIIMPLESRLFLSVVGHDPNPANLLPADSIHIMLIGGRSQCGVVQPQIPNLPASNPTAGHTRS